MGQQKGRGEKKGVLGGPQSETEASRKREVKHIK